jgi:hypothetical protein
VSDDGSAENNSRETAKKRPRGRPFEPGQSGNVNGRPRGSRNQRTLILEAVLDDAGEKVVRKIVQLALKGDAGLLKWIGDRLLPARRDRHIELSLGEVRTASDALEANRLVLAAVAAGTLTPSEGEALSKALLVHIGLHGTVEIEAQLGMLEQAQGLKLPS